MRVLMLVQSQVSGDSRVQREASTLVDAGYDVHVIGREVPADFAPPGGVTVHSVTRSRGMRPPEQVAKVAPGGGTAGAVGRAGRWLLLPEHRERVEHAWRRDARELALRAGPFDVVHAHDFNTLELGAELADLWKVPLVYDSHEYWTGRPLEGRPTPLRLSRVRRRESALGRRADAVITVGSGVARALHDTHGLVGVHVVRNTFPPLPLGSRTSSPAPRGLVYAGRLAADRELEVIAAASRRIDLPITLIGPADEAWLRRFDPGRASVLPAASLDVVDTMLADAGLALVTHSDKWPNHRLAMPNKLFHAVRVGVPAVATEVGELAREVRAHGIGTLYRPGDAAALVDAVGTAVDGYEGLLGRVAAAADRLSWAADADVLLGIYAKLPR